MSSRERDRALVRKGANLPSDEADRLPDAWADKPPKRKRVRRRAAEAEREEAVFAGQHWWNAAASRSSQAVALNSAAYDIETTWPERPAPKRKQVRR